MDRTLVVWRRLGKEHGEDSGFRANPPDVVETHIRTKVEAFRKTPSADWRWWQVNEDLLVERPNREARCRADGLIHYLPRRNWVILENAEFPNLVGWPWYVHIGDVAYRADLEAWVFSDLFVDVVVRSDNRTHSVVDLDDLTHAHELGIIDDPVLARSLASTQELVDLIRGGDFPPAEIRGADVLRG